jgi:hypothetical protein
VILPVVIRVVETLMIYQLVYTTPKKHAVALLSVGSRRGHVLPTLTAQLQREVTIGM